jgi:hypothetical protein
LGVDVGWTGLGFGVDVGAGLAGTFVGVSVGSGMGVSVGSGTGVSVGSGTAVFVGSAVGVEVEIGSGVFVGSAVGVEGIDVAVAVGTTSATTTVGVLFTAVLAVGVDGVAGEVQAVRINPVVSASVTSGRDKKRICTGTSTKTTKSEPRFGRAGVGSLWAGNHYSDTRYRGLISIFSTLLRLQEKTSTCKPGAE